MSNAIEYYLSANEMAAGHTKERDVINENSFLAVALSVCILDEYWKNVLFFFSMLVPIYSCLICQGSLKELLKVSLFLDYLYVGAACVCLCVCLYALVCTHLHAHAHMCVYVCENSVCVCVVYTFACVISLHTYTCLLEQTFTT